MHKDIEVSAEGDLEADGMDARALERANRQFARAMRGLLYEDITLQEARALRELPRIPQSLSVGADISASAAAPVEPPRTIKLTDLLPSLPFLRRT